MSRLHFLCNSAYQFIHCISRCTKTILAGTSIAFFLTPKWLTSSKLFMHSTQNCTKWVGVIHYERLRALALFRNTPKGAESKPFSATVWSIRIFGKLAEIPNFWNQRTALSRLHLAHVQNSTQIAQQRVVSPFAFTFVPIAHRPFHTNKTSQRSTY